MITKFLELVFKNDLRASSLLLNLARRTNPEICFLAPCSSAAAVTLTAAQHANSCTTCKHLHKFCSSKLKYFTKFTLAQRTKSTDTSFQASAESIPDKILLCNLSAAAITSLKIGKHDLGYKSWSNDQFILLYIHLYDNIVVT